MAHGNSLDRLVVAHERPYAAALGEIQHGSKHSHWMWYIFPQIVGLGRSSMAQHFAIRSRKEAIAYLDHPVLGPRYIECVQALQKLPTSDPVVVFGPINAMKLRSSFTLFEAVRANMLLRTAIDRWFGGARDRTTLQLLNALASPPTQLL